MAGGVTGSFVDETTKRNAEDVRTGRLQVGAKKLREVKDNIVRQGKGRKRNNSEMQKVVFPQIERPVGYKSVTFHTDFTVVT